MKRNFGPIGFSTPRIEGPDHAPILIMWIMAGLSGGFMGFVLGLTIGMGLR